MNFTIFLIIASWAFIIALVVEKIITAKEIGRIKREVTRNRDDIIYLYDQAMEPRRHNWIDWEKEYSISHK